MPHSSIFPLSYSKEVYRAVGRIIVETDNPIDFTEQMNQANVLNFTLSRHELRSVAFMDHVNDLMDRTNSDIEGHQIIMQAALEATERLDDGN